MIERLKPEDLIPSRWNELAQRIEVRQKWPAKFNPGHFYPEIRKLMRLGIASAWGCDNALLTALFIKNTFSGEECAVVLCWWAENSKNSLKLHEAFEAEAVRKACKRRYVSVFGSVRSKAIERLYRMKGYLPYEQIFVKHG